MTLKGWIIFGAIVVFAFIVLRNVAKGKLFHDDSRKVDEGDNLTDEQRQVFDRYFEEMNKEEKP